MSLQIAAGLGALLGLGVGVGDIASIVSLGRRIGNWWTTRTGDLEMLSLLGEDGSSILQRRGILDVLAFNKRWRKQIRLLSNGIPLQLEEDGIKRVMNVEELLHVSVLFFPSCNRRVGKQLSVVSCQELPLSTGVMVCLVAVLEQFTDRKNVQSLLHGVLKTLLQPNADGEEILRSQYTSRLNGWRSRACLRGLNSRAEECRLRQVQEGRIQSGHIPVMESKHVEEFLVWLLGTNDLDFKTMSSDIAGIAVCLCDLGIDILHVLGTGFSDEPQVGACSVIYSEEPFPYDSKSVMQRAMRLLSRAQSITIPLEHPWECISVFPIGMEVQNECRSVWKEGEKAAEAVRIGVIKAVASDFEDPRRDLKYAVMDGGEPVERTTPELNTTAMNYGLLMNRELLTGLQRSLGDLSPDLLRWLNESTKYTTLASVTTGIGAPEMTDQCKISAFCIFQSFFMGYYYSIFGRLIDTSTLALQTVEGAWRFRSEDLLRRMRFSFLRSIGKSPERMNSPHFKTFSRRDVFEILVMLFMGSGETILGQHLNNHGRKWSGCMGIVGRRTMLINTMLGKCSSPRETGGFTLLDVDVGGLPRDHNGLIMSGENIPSHGSEILDTSILAGKLERNSASEVQTWMPPLAWRRIGTVTRTRPWFACGTRADALPPCPP